MRARSRLFPLLFRLAVYAAAVFVVLNAPAGGQTGVPSAATEATLSADRVAPPARARSRPASPARSPAPSAARIALLAILAAGALLELGTRRPVWR